MRSRGWLASVCLLMVAAACGDQPTEVVPERGTGPAPGTVALATSSTEDGLSITTDKDDYQPGDTVWFTGSGWPADDTLDIVLTDEPLTHAPHEWAVPVDGSGGFRDSTYVVDIGDLGVTFTLTATSRTTGRSLTVIFTDANSAIGTFSITPSPVTASGTLTWSASATCTGPAGGANSCSNHGSSVGGAVPNTYTIELLRASGACGAAGQVFVQVASAGTTAGTAGGSVTAPATAGSYAYRTRHPSQAIGGNSWGAVGQGTTPCVTIVVEEAGNPPPTADAGSYGDQNEGSSVSLDGSGSTDDGTITYQWSIEAFSNADGGSCTFDGGISTGVSPDVTCNDDGTLTVKVVVTDDDGASADDTAEITIVNVAPAAAADIAGAGYAGNEGAGISLAGSVTDAGANDTHTYLWAYAPVSGVDPGTACSISNGTTLTPTISCDDDGVFKVTLTATDDDAADSPVAEATLTVANVAPTANADVGGLGYSGDEGEVISLAGSAADQGAHDTHSYVWGYSAIAADAGAACTISGGTTLTPTISCTDDGTFKVTLTVQDDDGASSPAAEATVSLSNVSPSLGAITGLPVGPVQVGTSVSANLTFTDPGSNDSHKSSVDWEDGTIDNTDPDPTPVAGSHSYAAPGIYTVKITVTDDDNGSNVVRFEYVVVYDPSAGFVTGGGWINSPAGAYPADPSLIGKANFGFVSKYLKGATVPTGNTEFQFHAGNLSFSSSSYEWLVVQGSGSSKATYKGTGTVNGVPGYGFLLSAIDGSPDRFRIKIWQSGGSVVYDNQVSGGTGDNADPSTAIAGGSVVIHVPKK